jgi:hypothetical protein
MKRGPAHRDRTRRLRIDALLGRGGMGIVDRGTSIRSGSSSMSR